MKHLEEVIINYDKKLMEANAEIERLNNIIKEVREYIENNKYDFEKWETQMLLDILKGSDKE